MKKQTDKIAIGGIAEFRTILIRIRLYIPHLVEVLLPLP